MALRCDDIIDRKRLNSCVLNTSFWRELSNQKNKPKKLGNAFSDALLHSRSQMLFGSQCWWAGMYPRPKGTPFCTHIQIVCLFVCLFVCWNKTRKTTLRLRNRLILRFNFRTRCLFISLFLALLAEVNL